MAIILYTLLVIYLLTLCYLAWGLRKLPINSTIEAKTFLKFTIVVVFRNENENLPNLLKSFQKLNYPKDAFNILMINDGSDQVFDFSPYQLPLKCMLNKRFSKAPKKDAITLAVNEAPTEWLVITDADCEVPSAWLSKLNDFLDQSTYQMVCGPVLINKSEQFIHHFQAWDFLSLQFVTIGSFGLRKPFVCNGANMAFTQSIFKAVEGYHGNNHNTSGDDVFLLQKIVQKDKSKVGYLFSEDFLIKTKALNSWPTVINQRVRWGGKAKNYKSLWGLYLSFLAFIVSIVFVWQFFQFNYKFLLIKFLIDAFVLIYFAKKMKKNPKYLGLSLVIYPLLIVFISLKSIFYKINWRD